MLGRKDEEIKDRNIVNPMVMFHNYFPALQCNHWINSVPYKPLSVLLTLQNLWTGHFASYFQPEKFKRIRIRILMLKCLYFLQDWLDIDFGIAEGVDFIAVSFVKSAEVIKTLKSYIRARSPKR